MEKDMKTADLLLRCYANKHDGQWQAFCIDLSLAVQGDDFPEVKDKLESMIYEYVTDALGEDREYAEQLLNRRAPLKQVLTYYFYSFMYQIGAFRNGIHRLFRSPMRLVPQAAGHE